MYNDEQSQQENFQPSNPQSSQSFANIQSNKKNTAKCFTKQLQKYIQNNLAKSENMQNLPLEDPQLKVFLELKSKQIATFGKQRLTQYFSNATINQFAEIFFGNLVWVKGIMKNNKKTSISQLFKENNEYYQEVLQKKVRLE